METNASVKQRDQLAAYDEYLKATAPINAEIEKLNVEYQAKLAPLRDLNAAHYAEYVEKFDAANEVFAERERMNPDVNVGECEYCETSLKINTTMIAKWEVFCPNQGCEKFSQTFWISR